MRFNLDDHVSSMNEDQLLRLEDVHTEQRKLGMSPRKDSLLTYNYAMSTTPDYFDSAQTVAKELVFVDYIYQNTRYADIIEEVMREIALHVRQRYRVNWTTAWDITRFYVPDMLKMYLLKKIPSSQNA